MFRIARNALIDQYRRAGVRDGRPLELPEEDDQHDLEELRVALAECIAPFLARLPEPYAQALRWVDLEGLTQTEAADKAAISVSGMKSRVQRGRTKLHELLEACCKFELDCRGKVIGYEAKNRCNCD
jgi:RNA polymerase sigma-70 factor (ECF subfamily)